MKLVQDTEPNVALQLRIATRACRNKQLKSSYVPDDVGSQFDVEPVVQDNVLRLHVDEEHNPPIPDDPVFLNLQNPSQCSSQFTQMDSFNPTSFS